MSPAAIKRNCRSMKCPIFSPDFNRIRIFFLTTDFHKSLLRQNSRKSVHLAVVLLLAVGDGEAKWWFSRICKRERKEKKSGRAKASPCIVSSWMWSVMMITYWRRWFSWPTLSVDAYSSCSPLHIWWPASPIVMRDTHSFEYSANAAAARCRDWVS